MNKRELIEIKPKKINWKTSSVIFRVPSIKYIITAAIERISSGKILVLDFYDKDMLKEKNYKPYLKTFFCRDGYISLLCSENKWSEASFINIKYFGNLYNNNIFLFRTENDEKRTAKYLGFDISQISAIGGIVSFQNKIMTVKRENKKLIIQRGIDNLMKSVKAVPKRFSEWIINKVFDNKRYLFYKKLTKKRYWAFCSSCGREVNISYAKHNIKGICPACKKKIIFKSVGKAKYIVDSESAAIIEKTAEGFLVRYFTAHKRHSAENMNPEIDFYEYYRIFVNISGIDVNADYYIPDQCIDSKTRKWRKCKPKYHKSFYFNVNPIIEESFVYTANLHYELKNTALDRLDFGLFCKNAGRIYAEYAINDFITNPIVEYFTKMKLYNIAKYIVNNNSRCFVLNPDGKTLKQLLGITREHLLMLQKINAYPEHLAVMQKFVRNNINFKLDDVLEAVEILSLDAVEKLTVILKYCTIHKALKYLKEQNNEKSIYKNAYYYYNPYNNTASDWYDYVLDCKILAYDLKNEYVLFPKNLGERHAEVSKLIKVKNTKLMDAAISKKYDRLVESYGYEYENLCIVVPKNSKDIVKEGHSLSHCVGSKGYIENMAKDISDILFIRNKDNLKKSYYTVEMKNGKIIQCRGSRNCSANDEVKDFIKRWTANIESKSVFADNLHIKEPIKLDCVPVLL